LVVCLANTPVLPPLVDAEPDFDNTPVRVVPLLFEAAAGVPNDLNAI